MKIYAMFVRLSNHNITDNGWGWRFEGFTTSDKVVEQFIKDVKKDIDNTKDNQVFTKTLDYHITVLDF